MNRREFIGTCSILLGATALPWPVVSGETNSAMLGQWQQLPLATKRMVQLGIAGGDGFQYVHALTYAPSNPTYAYLSVDQSGVWRSDDGGNHWTPKFNGFYAYGARSIAVDPNNPLVVLAAGFLGFNAENAAIYPNRYQGIFLTIDGGESWSFVHATDFYKQVSKGDLFAFDSTTWNGQKGRSLLAWCATASEGLMRSEDGGETWLQTSCKEKDLHALALLPDGTGALLLASPQGLWRYSTEGVEEFGKGLPTYPRSIAVSKAKPKRVHVALGLAGVAVSDDGGRTFSPAVKQYGLPLSPIDVTDIAVSPVNEKMLYLRANLAGQPPYVSTDGGASWKRPSSVDPEGLLDKVGFYFSSPFAPHPTEAKTCLHVTNGRARIIRTTDSGDTWHFSGSGFCGARMVDILFLTATTMIFCLTDHGLWVTTDGGQSFSELSTSRLFGGKSLAAAAASGEHIVAGFGSWEKKCLLVSHNGGESFQSFPEMLDKFSFVGFQPQTPGRVYAGPYVTDDFGKSWRKLSETILAMTPDGSTLFAITATGTSTSTLMTSIDGGSSFTPKASLNCSATAVNQVVAISPDNLLLATTQGVYRIQKEQGELRDFRHGLAKDYFGTMYVNTVAYDPQNPNTVFAGRRALGYGNGNGVFMSSDNGQYWQDMNLNLSPGVTIFSIKVSPFDGSVYLGTSFGTFRLNRSESAEPAKSAVIDSPPLIGTPTLINIRKQ